ATGISSQVSRPAAGVSSPAMQRRRLDLPLPLAPRSRSRPPTATLNARPANTARSPRRQASPAPAKAVTARSSGSNDRRASTLSTTSAHEPPLGAVRRRGPTLAQGGRGSEQRRRRRDAPKNLRRVPPDGGGTRRFSFGPSPGVGAGGGPFPSLMGASREAGWGASRQRGKVSVRIRSW